VTIILHKNAQTKRDSIGHSNFVSANGMCKRIETSYLAGTARDITTHANQGRANSAEVHQGSANYDASRSERSEHTLQYVAVESENLGPFRSCQFERMSLDLPKNAATRLFPLHNKSVAGLLRHCCEIYAVSELSFTHVVVPLSVTCRIRQPGYPRRCRFTPISLL
jgi:hypothetical protein